MKKICEKISEYRKSLIQKIKKIRGKSKERIVVASGIVSVNPKLPNLIEFLKEKYYPNETLVLSDSFSDYLWDYYDLIPDVVVLSEVSGNPLAFFQLVDLSVIVPASGAFMSGPIADAIHLKRHTGVLYQAPYYLVVADSTEEDDSCEFTFFNIVNCMQKRFHEDYTKFATMPLPYNILISNEKNRINRQQFIRKERIIKWITLVFYCLIPALLLTALILDALKIYVITKLRLCMLGLIILSVLLPTIAEISIKDFSVTFKNEKKAKKDDM